MMFPVIERRVLLILLQCMLTMSDFQLITGLSILVSGYSQRCSLQAYYWQRVVHLAWFSSITHLCCLTFLREHFARNKVAYYWRLPGMITLVIMLIFALVPTAHYVWDDDRYVQPKPSDYAICFLNKHQDGVAEDYYDAAQQRMVLSAVFMGIGMLNRLWHLFRAPTQIYVRLRGFFGHYTRTGLSHIRAWTLEAYPGTYVVAAVLYRPLLAMLLSWRFLIDVISSRAFEVWWLILSFSWGTMNLWGRHPQEEDKTRYKWTFGQVMALLVLAAPIIASAEGYITGKQGVMRLHFKR